ncbi:hypothetical protein HDU85_004050 [Gaertneriomyces sp. JEL0708]|nr:hypothetical protein HDU85_004050 [Gaertneriomyces sp. JEL0708]
MVKLYLRYRLANTFGLVASGNSNACFSADGKHAVTPMLENVGVYDVKKGELINEWRDEDSKAEVTCICRAPDNVSYAVGYNDGSIRIWDFQSSNTAITFNGHKSAVTCLMYNADGTKLVSGSKDTDLIVWDIVAEEGLYRLRGHKDQITSVKFLSQNGLDHIVSASKDSLLKFWDLQTQHCVETIIAHRGEVWSLEVTPDEKLMFTGAADGEIRVWKIDSDMLRAKLDPSGAAIGGSWNDDEDQAGEEGLITKKAVIHYGKLERQSKERVITLKVHPSGEYLGSQGADRLVELYKFRTPEELKKRLNRLKKRQKEKKAEKKTKKPETMDVDEPQEDEPVLTVTDEIPRVAHIRCAAKVRSFDFAPSAKHRGSKDSSLQILCALTNNSLEVHAADIENKEQPTRLVTTLEMPGHRSDVRTLALSSDDQMLVTGSQASIKIWNIHSRQCAQTMDSGYALCCEFLPGDQHVVVGTKTGELQLFDLARGTMIEEIKAHDGPVWSLQVRPDRKGLTTGSQDKEVRFWDLGMVHDEDLGGQRLTLVHTRTLKMSDDVLCVRYSPDGRLLAVALLDSTVKVLYADTLKFSLSLYGHKLPVMSMDISSDSSLIVTGSADKTVKIWGLDFGDCHKSIFAHQDSVMCTRFVWGTHYLFTAGKDRMVKYWDTDKFESIMQLKGHCGEVWALAVGKYGNVVVSGSHDRSIRVWEKTDDQFTLEEEREKELEETYEAQALADADKFDAPIGSGAEEGAMRAEENNDETGAAGKKTGETLKAGERLLEALEVYEEDRRNLTVWKRLKEKTPELPMPQRSPFIVATGKTDISGEGYVLGVASKIRAGDLEQALVVLPFNGIISLLRCLVVWAEMRWNPLLTLRTLTHILHTHYSQLQVTRSLHATLRRLMRAVSKLVKNERDALGFSMAGLKHLRGRQLQEIGFVGEEEDEASGWVPGAKGEKRKRN